ncbi:MAG: carbohydrate kinase family protein [Phycisphaerae bacterium]|jgi:sugar/nucleoside kinase (ribokinase family)
MPIDILIFNTAVADFRSNEFEFVERLAGKGGLARGKTKDMPAYTQQQYKNWIDSGLATAGGPGNTAPLVAKAGIKTAVGVNLGKGGFDGLDANGRFFYDTMIANSVDMSATFIHQSLPTGVTFVYNKPCGDRGGLAYFPNANNDFDFKYFKPAVERLSPKIVFYMYSGLSDRGDDNGGKDLADFMNWCRAKGIITTADSHTLAGNPGELIESGASVPEYKLLEPLLSELDIFFTSYDEARMIENTISGKGKYIGVSEEEYISYFLKYLSEKFWRQNKNARVFGVTVKDGAFVIYRDAQGNTIAPQKITSKFMVGNVKDLVGAGDSFRAGFVAYIVKNIEKFRNGKINIEQAVQMANIFASLYIKAPLNNRYSTIGRYEKMLSIINDNSQFSNFEELVSIVLQ